MKLIRPVEITPDRIVSTTATDGEALWSAGATYAKGDRRIHNGDEGPSIYQSAADGNKGNQPDISPDDWVRVGPTNRWALFDGSATTVSQSEGGFEITFTVNEVFNSLAFFEIYGAKLTISIKQEGGGVVFTHERELIDNSMVIDGYTYFFEPFDYIRDGVVQNIPPYPSTIVTVTIEGVGKTGVGEFIVGGLAELGEVEHGATHGIRDYSRIKEDSFGNRVMQQGAWAKKNNLTVFVDKHRHRYVSRILTEARGEPRVFIGSDDPLYEPLVVFGSIKDWQSAVSYPTKTLFTIEIQGLI